MSRSTTVKVSFVVAWSLACIATSAVILGAGQASLSVGRAAAAGMQSRALQTADLIAVGHLGGAVAAVALPDSGSYAYVGMGSGLASLSTADPSAPCPVGTLPLDGTDVSGISLQGTTACLLNGTSLHTVDLTDPTQPTLLGSLALAEELIQARVQWVGDSAYVAAGWTGGLQVFDLTDPTQPQYVTGTESYPALGLEVLGGVAYVAAGNEGLKLYDVADPAHPNLLGTCGQVYEAWDVAVVGNLAYVAAKASLLTGGLVIVDVSDPAQPAKVGEYVANDAPQAVVVVSDTAYLGYWDRLTVLDVSDPASPAEIPGAAQAGCAQNLARRGDVLYVGGDGLRMLDIHAPASPALLGQCVWPLDIQDVWVPPPEALPQSAPLADDAPLAYVCADEQLWVMDLTVPAVPAVLGSTATVDGALWVADHHAYVAGWNWGLFSNSLEVIDVSDPSQPTARASLALPGGTPNDLVVADGVAYVATAAGGHGTLRLIDASDPDNMSQIVAYPTPGDARRLAVLDDKVYLADGAAGLRILDVSNPAGGVAELGQIPPPTGTATSCLYVVEDKVYIGSNGAAGWWLRSYDVTNPASPVLVDEATGAEGSINDVAVYDDWVYAGVSGQSLHVLSHSGLVSLATYPSASVLHVMLTNLWNKLFVLTNMGSFGCRIMERREYQPSETRTPTPSPTVTLTPSPTPSPTPVAAAMKRVSVDPAIVVPGQNVTYTVILSWNSPDGSPAQSMMRDALPEHLLYQPGTLRANFGAVDDSNPRNLIWRGTIEDESSAVITFQAELSCWSLTRLTNAEYPAQIINRAAGNIGPFGFSAAVAVQVIKPDLQITAVEVTQAIQNLNNDTLLIKDKETYVRVFIKALWLLGGVPVDSCDVPDVRVRLSDPTGEELDALNPPIPANVMFSEANRPTVQERDELNQSAYFRLPAKWRSQDYLLIAEVNPDLMRPDAVLTNNEWVKKVEFFPTKPIRVVFHMLQYKVGDQLSTPTRASAEQLPTYLNVLPIARSNIDVYWSSGALQVTWPISTSDDGKRVLQLIDKQKNWEWDTDATYRVGVFSTSMTSRLLGQGWQPGNSAWVRLRTDLSKTGMDLAHELGHNLNARHIPCAVEDETGGAWASARVGYPNNCWIGQGTRDGDYGFDTRARNPNVRQPDEWSDFMGYGDRNWVSAFTYEDLHNELLVAKSSAAALQGERFLVMGTVTTTAADGRIGSVFRSDNQTYVNNALDGPYTLEVQDLFGLVLASDSFGLYLPDPPDERPSVLHFNRMLAAHPNAARIVLKQDGVALHTVEASAHPPTVTLTAPLAGTALTDTLTVSWTAADADGDALTFVVLYSADDGQTWQPLGIDLTETHVTVDATTLPGGNMCLVRVAASDGFHTTYAGLDGYLTAPRKAPTVTIWHPEDGATYPDARWVVLEGQAYDQDRQFLEGDALVWTSHRDGALGSGEEAEPPALTVGWHVITCTATDGQGLSASSSVTITVTPTIFADLDEDCDVDIVDIMLVASRWNSVLGDPGYEAPMDLDGDGDIDIVDIMLVATHWGESCDQGE